MGQELSLIGRDVNMGSQVCQRRKYRGVNVRDRGVYGSVASL